METKSLDKILVANRGEIALRIMRTCRKLGIASVAVYSDADVRSPHVAFADEAVRVGPPPSAESYLNIGGILAATEKTGAEGIHPGYGFLSENAGFAEACQQAGVVFIGPSPESIRAMGAKNQARKLAVAAGVPVVPGYDDENQDPEYLCAEVQRVGLPVLIKASAGGGGIGMRLIRDASGVIEDVLAARREAERSFGDGTLLIEKLIEDARHIEVQIIGDHHGNLVHLFERDCSIQRRHQKVVEETPSPAVHSELRSRLGGAALAIGRAIGYYNAGTVEFIVAPSGEFYFIEVNTRLQVEHTVTEMITGLDLVELQIGIAEGKPLAASAMDARPEGHAIEARLYAEDPDSGFVPSTGTIYAFGFESQPDSVRLDAGVEPGVEVGIFYDPMLAKVIAQGPDRDVALRRLAYALKNLSVIGVRTNRAFLVRVLEHPGFRSGRYDTGFIAEHINQLAEDEGDEQSKVASAVVAIYLEYNLRLKTSFPPNYRNNPYRDPVVRLKIDESVRNVSYSRSDHDTYNVSVTTPGSAEAWYTRARVVSCERGAIRLSLDGLQKRFRIVQVDDYFHVEWSTGSRVVERLSRYPIHQGSAERESTNSPMPGQVLRVLVVTGQEVSSGEPLVILEAMKMEQTLRASGDGVVEAILVKAGDVVAPGDALVKIGPRAGPTEGG